MPAVHVDLSRLPRWRVVGAVLVSPACPDRYGGFSIMLHADDDMIAMRAAAVEIEAKQPSTRGRPILFTTIVRC